MAVSAILFGLLPIMWSPAMQTGADVMKRIATPMIGGVISSAFLNLLIYPVIYVIWRRRELPDKTEEETAPFIPPQIVPLRQNRQRVFKWITLIIAMIAIFYGGKCAWQKLRPTQISSAPFLTQNVNDLTVNFIAREGALRQGNSELLIEFRDRNGQLVDVGNAKFDMDMNMPGMQMHSGGKIERTNTPGRYRAKIKIDMSGDWSAKISLEGPRGKAERSFSLTVK
jgi:hypothetical protein